MDIFECISKRVSVRAYTTRAIDKDILEKLVDAGRRAPTARAVEPWEFVVITDKKILENLSQKAVTGVFLKGAAACLAVFCQDTKYYLEDGCAATENILLVAADLGLGACWIAGDKKDYAQEISLILGAAANLKLVSLIALGWPAKETKQNKKRKLEDLIHWERF